MVIPLGYATSRRRSLVLAIRVVVAYYVHTAFDSPHPRSLHTHVRMRRGRERDTMERSRRDKSDSEVKSSLPPQRHHARGRGTQDARGGAGTYWLIRAVKQVS